jgi:predicted phage tail protein
MGDSSPSEARNNLQSNAVITVVDLIGEGEDGGLIDGSKSILFNDIVFQNDDDSYNFEGIEWEERVGLPDQDPLDLVTEVETPVTVSQQITVANGGWTEIISDENVNDVKVVLLFPRMMKTEDDGDIARTSVVLRISVNGTVAANPEVRGKCVSEYEKQFLIRDLSRFGDAPWSIKVERITADPESVRVQNEFYWSSYTTLINVRLIYPNSAIVAHKISAEQFGRTLPTRAYWRRGMYVDIPKNYDPDTRAYASTGAGTTGGVWDGTFKKGITDNPAWHFREIVIHDRLGLGLDDSMCDKWELYNIAQTCDELVPDGFGGYEPRFTINTQVTTRHQGVELLGYIVSTFWGMFYNGNGQIFVSQDRPRDSSMPIVPANVFGGEFHYSSGQLETFYTVAIVSWNDPDNFFRLTPEVVEADIDMIRKYGWNPVDLTAWGCTSRGQARRYGKTFLFTNLYEGDLCSYSGSLDNVAVMPGEVVTVGDPDYATIRFEGRIQSVSIPGTQVVVDKQLTLAAGTTYYLSAVLPSGAMESRQITNTLPAATATLTLSTAFSTNPQAHAIFVITGANLERQFRVLSVAEEKPNQFNVSSKIYNSGKWAWVEDGLHFEPPIPMPIVAGPLLPPTDLSFEEYTYVDGQNNLFGAVLSWAHSLDARAARYEVQLQEVDVGPYEAVGSTATNSLTVAPIEGGTYNFRVRATAPGIPPSVWATYSAMGIVADPDALDAVTGLQVVGGGATFTGRNCEMEWTFAYHPRLKDFVVQIAKTDDMVLRTDPVARDARRYTYDYLTNQRDTGGSPVRTFVVTVWARDVYDKLSAPASLQVSNPAPSMAGLMPTVLPMTRGISIDWRMITPADNDLEGFWLYCSTTQADVTNLAAEALIASTDAQTRQWFAMGLEPDGTYYVRVVPVDGFGAGEASATNSAEPLRISSEDVLAELAGSIEISDSDGNVYPTDN